MPRFECLLYAAKALLRILRVNLAYEHHDLATVLQNFLDHLSSLLACGKIVRAE